MTIFLVSCKDGSSIEILSNLLFIAESFSKNFLYSSEVVAPIHFILPLAKAGFNIFEASTAPSEFPAPIRVCISSKNSIM